MGKPMVYTPLSKDILAQMVEHTRLVVEQRKKEVPLEGVRALASMQRRPIDLCSYIQEDPRLSLIAQVRRTAPESDLHIENYDPLVLAKGFESNGARALSVATNEKHYHGGIADLTLVTQYSKLPVIRHDFVYDEYQIVEGRAAGADAILLIAALLEPSVLCDLISITHRNRMVALVQVQTKAELLQALQFEPRMIAISNRHLRTFEVDLATTHHLRDYIPSRMTVLSVSGLKTAEDVAYVREAGVDGVLIGQALLTATHTQQAIEELFRLVWQ